MRSFIFFRARSTYLALSKDTPLKSIEWLNVEWDLESKDWDFAKAYILPYCRTD